MVIIKIINTLKTTCKCTMSLVQLQKKSQNTFCAIDSTIFVYFFFLRPFYLPSCHGLGQACHCFPHHPFFFVFWCWRLIGLSCTHFVRASLTLPSHIFQVFNCLSSRQRFRRFVPPPFVCRCPHASSSHMRHRHTNTSCTTAPPKHQRHHHKTHLKNIQPEQQQRQILASHLSNKTI